MRMGREQPSRSGAYASNVRFVTCSTNRHFMVIDAAGASSAKQSAHTAALSRAASLRVLTSSAERSAIMGKPAALDTAIAEAAKLELSDAFFRRRLRRSRGFAALEDASVVVCVLPGTELSFAGEVSCGLLAWRARVIKHKTAVFRQIKKDWALGHRDALEFPDGQIVLLTLLCKGQQATVLQLPAEPKTDVKSEARLRAAFVG
jgi:hypothetical protein